VRVRSYRQRWLLAVSLFAAVAIEAGSAASYQALRPIPPPPPWTLTLDVGGEGEGQVTVTVYGKRDGEREVRRCTTAQGTCYFEVPRDRWVSLTAVRGDQMTFEGWGGCEPYGDDVLSCDLMMFQDREVVAVFGEVPDEVDVAWVETPVSDVPLPGPQPERPELIEPEKLDEPPLEVAMIAPEQVPPVVPPPTPPEPPAAAESSPPAMMQPPPANMRMVEVTDDHVVDEAPDDATHLSDKNRDVADETVATDTNLEKELSGEQPLSSESDDTTSPEIGGPEDRIAQLESAESPWNALDRSSDHSGDSETAKGQVVGESGDDGEEGTGGDRSPGILAMRDIGGRGALLDDKRGDGKKSGRKGAPGLTKQLDLDDYERIVGKDAAEDERRLARARMSGKKGRWERKLEAIKSSLENFAPDVRPGNQTALKTRAAPYAVYIARMHRRIHELWGFGFLDDLDGKSSSNPLNDFNLMTQLEIAINPDGTVYKTTIAHTSGRLEFDVAAIDVVLSAAPYESPPEVIRSVDGRAYMRWGFYRNWRQCGTFNVEPYILTDIPGGAQPFDDGAALTAARPKRGDKPVTPTPSGDVVKATPRIADQAVSYTANMWVAGFTSVSPKRMIRVSALPFYAGGRVAAATQKDLEDLYEGLLVESGAFKDFRVVSPAAFTRRTGVPSELNNDAMVLLIWTKKARFGVALTPTRSGEYRATRILR